MLSQQAAAAPLPAPMPVRVPSIAPFQPPESWVRPSFLPPTPPPPPAPPVPPSAKVQEDDKGKGKDTSGHDDVSSRSKADSALGSERAQDAMDVEERERSDGVSRESGGDSCQKEQKQQKQPQSEQQQSEAAESKEQSGSIEGEGGTRSFVTAAAEEVDAESRGNNGKGGDDDATIQAGADDKVSSDAKDVAQRRGGGVEEEKKGDKEDGTETPAASGAAIITGQEGEGEAEPTSKEVDEEAARPEAAAAAATAASAKAKAEAQAEASKKAREEATAVDTAQKEAEKRVRRLRVSLILKRLRDAADGRRKAGRYTPQSSRNRQPLSPAAVEKEASTVRRGPGGSIIAVPGLRDRSRPPSPRRRRQNGDGSTDRGRDGVADNDTGREGADADAAAVGSDAAVDQSAGGAGSDAGTGEKTGKPTSEKRETREWSPPLLGKRRLTHRIECAKRLAAMSRGGGPSARLKTLLIGQSASAADKRLSKACWLDTKLARMHKTEGGEWKEWQCRVGSEGTTNPGQAAGPILPFGFVPRLAHRALGAYALVRTFSRPLRLSPASSIAFLRALSLKLRTPLLDAVHCQLLRRVCCLLRGRAGGWAKGSSAQRELDWKYMDEVSASVETLLRFGFVVLF